MGLPCVSPSEARASDVDTPSAAVRKQRPYMVLFTKCDGQPWQTGPYTKLEAERRLRNTHWGYRADPRIVRVK